MASSYYDLQSWQSHLRQNAWDQAPTPRQGSNSATQRDEAVAFGPQFEEVDRAIDNLLKSGKLVGRTDQFVAPGRQYGGSPHAASAVFTGLSKTDPRQGGRSQSMDFDPMRMQHGNNLQNFYGNARYPARTGENDSMQQAKRRLAAQRERDLRNYHQEQQYNRNISTHTRSDRSSSPSTMTNEEDRRDLMARQHKALYGDQAFYDKSAFQADNQTLSRTTSASMVGGENGPMQDARSGSESNASPATASNNFGTFDLQTSAQQQSSRTSNSSPGESPPRSSKPSVAPGAIGTRPQIANAGIKRNTPPASASAGLGLSAEGNAGERATSAASNPPSGRESMTSSGTWGTGSGVWGKGSLNGVSSAVWG